MKRFSYRLEPVLKNREDKEEKAVLAQARAQKDYSEKLKTLERMKEELQNIYKIDPETRNAVDFINKWIYIEFLDKSIQKQEEIVRAAGIVLENRRRELINARKDKLILQKHKEKLYENFVSELNKWETKINDDQCTALAHRRKA